MKLSSHQSITRRGLTLVELLVVLTILSVMALVAVTSVEPTLEQGRENATRAMLEEIRSAVVGPRNSAVAWQEGSFSGFLFDYGRFPVAVGDDAFAQLKSYNGQRYLYLSNMQDLSDPIRDAWGTALEIDDDPTGFNVVSAGPDKEMDTDDDLSFLDGPLLPANFQGSAVIFLNKSVDENDAADLNGYIQIDIRDPAISMNSTLSEKLTLLGATYEAAGYTVTAINVSTVGQYPVLRVTDPELKTPFPDYFTLNNWVPGTYFMSISILRNNDGATDDVVWSGEPRMVVIRPRTQASVTITLNPGPGFTEDED